MAPETAPEPAPQEPREAGVGLMFVIATAPKKGWAVKTVIKQSPADLSVLSLPTRRHPHARARSLSLAVSASLSPPPPPSPPLPLSSLSSPPPPPAQTRARTHKQGKIQEGHVLTAVDGKPVTELRSLNELSKMLMGECLVAHATQLLLLALFLSFCRSLKRTDFELAVHVDLLLRDDDRSRGHLNQPFLQGWVWQEGQDEPRDSSPFECLPRLLFSFPLLPFRLWACV